MNNITLREMQISDYAIVFWEKLGWKKQDDIDMYSFIGTTSINC